MKEYNFRIFLKINIFLKKVSYTEHINNKFFLVYKVGVITIYFLTDIIYKKIFEAHIPLLFVSTSFYVYKIFITFF